MSNQNKSESRRQLNDLIQKRAAFVRATFGDSVRQIYGVTEQFTPDPVGSAVLLQFADRRFLVSAAHVFRAMHHGSVYVSGARELVQIVGELFHTPAVDPRPLVQDEYDLCFIELTGATLSGMEDVPALGAEDIDVNDVAQTGRPYVGLGFPWRRSVRETESRTVRSNTMSITSFCDPDLYDRLGLSEHEHLAVMFDQASVLFDGQRRHAPDPQGMSGGAVWRCDDLLGLRPGDAPGKLVGVLTEHRRKKKAIVAVRIALATEGIRREYPELKSHIPEARRFKLRSDNDAQG